MSGPPKGVNAGDLWQKLTERPRPTCDFQFPGKDINGNPLPLAKLWILSESELHACRANATKVARDLVGDSGKIGDLGYEEIYRNEMATEMVSLCVRAHDDPTFPCFPSAKAVRQRLTTDEIALIADAYNAHRVESGPMLAEMTKAEMEAWLKALSEGAGRVPLARCSGDATIDLVMFLVSKIKTLSTGTGSVGSPPSESSPPASELVDESERQLLE